MKRPRILLHAGLSKCGSSALQWQLHEDSVWLQEHRIAVCWETFPEGAAFDVALAGDQWSLGTEQLPGGSTSLARVFEQYKAQRRKDDADAAAGVLDRMAAFCEQALETNDVAILSAEAFETSLALRDPLFAHLLERLEHLADVHVVVYLPTPAQHAISSWQEWGWHEGYRLHEWISLYTYPSSASSFWDGTVGDYWGQLARLDSWLTWWTGRLPRPMSVHLRDTIPDKDVVRHFYKEHLLLEAPSWQPRQNVSWPAWALPLLLLVAPAFDRDYARFDDVRRLLLESRPEQLGLEARSVADLISIVEDALSFALDDEMRRAEDTLGLGRGALGAAAIQGAAADVLRDLRGWDSLDGAAATRSLVRLLRIQLRAKYP